ncbi:AAEL011365-PA [Aedes aegypti]|uniref:AAEL011365-PA n=1 Tax=Aedes aegypti TaxID=7159 RepID=Q16Q88_AEDAE|nr:AAEL011365-PA [Aedes aegypti]
MPADTPSITKVRPLISPTGLQITTRGRVVFNIVPVSQPLTEVVAAAVASGTNAAAGELMPPSYINLKSYLSPEYVNCLGKKPNFSESDVEKKRPSHASQCHHQDDKTTESSTPS